MTRSEWIAALRTAFADMDSVVRDMLRRPSERELGPVSHRDIYDESSAKIAVLLDHVPEDERGDPAGLGGAGPVA